MRKRIFTRQLMVTALSLVISHLSFSPARAQLSSNPDKFLGNITTGYGSDVDTHGFTFYKYWNQITPENATKWDAIEPSRGNFSYGGADKAANYAKQHKFPFKYHTFIWGGQYPGWMNNLSTPEQYSAIIEYFDGVKAHYPDLEIIDVVNEAIPGHNPAPYKAALGGDGRTGYDWIVKAFQLAHERWPNAILIYNDYNSFTWQKTEFINLVRTLRNAGAPIDAYGHQSHDLTDISLSNFKNAMTEVHNALQMPMYSTEFDIGTSDDKKQETQYKNLIPLLWEAEYCAGITLWGWIYSSTWTTDGNSGLIRDGKERPALTWLREYMKSDAAKNAKSPFPGFKKEASIYVKPAALKVALNDILPIVVDASMATKTIEKVDLYVGDDLIATMTEAPYITEYTASTTGQKTLKAVVTTTDGATFERLSQFQVTRGTKRRPYNDVVVELPGTIKAEEYDEGMSGVSYNNATRNVTTATKDGQWMEYTVDVKEEGYYTMEAEIASTKAGGMFHLSEYAFGDLTFYTNFTEVPNTSSEFLNLRCPIMEPLTAGRHVFCLNIDKGGFYVKSLTFKRATTFSLPGTVEAEDFYLSDGGKIVATADGYAWGNTSVGNWTEYSVNVAQAGKYSYEATVSAAVSGSSFSMYLTDSEGNEKTLGTVSVPNTGKDIYQVKKGVIRNSLKEGQQKLRFIVKGAGCSIDKVELICTDPVSIETVTTDAADAPVYNLYGVKVGTMADWQNLQRGLYIVGGKKMMR